MQETTASNSCSRAGRSDRRIASAPKRAASFSPRSSVRLAITIALAAWRGEVRGDQFDHLAGADEQDLDLAQVLEQLRGQPHRRGGHADRMRADLGRGAHLLGHREGALEQLVQRACRACRRCRPRAPPASSGRGSAARPAPSSRARWPRGRGGEMIELVATHFAAKNPKSMTVANRTLERGEKLASHLGAEAMRLSDLPARLSEFDAVISCTASALPLIGLGAVERALKARRRRPMFMVDLAVPRDIEPEVAQLDDVYLYTVDDLSSDRTDRRRKALGRGGAGRSHHRIRRAEFCSLDGSAPHRTADPGAQRAGHNWRATELARARKLLAKGAASKPCSTPCRAASPTRSCTARSPSCTPARASSASNWRRPCRACSCAAVSRATSPKPGDADR